MAIVSLPEIITRAAAIAIGQRWYFTGNPCKHGHIAKRLVSNGTCLRCSNARASAWARKNKAKRNAIVRRYYHSREAIAEKFRARRRRWAKKNRDGLLVIKRRRAARQRMATGSHTADDVRDLFKKQRGKCVICHSTLGDTYHVDHIEPLGRGGGNDKRNLQLLCPDCNHQKWCHDPIEFMQRKGFLL